jgi:flagellar basal body-associated protein FliL
MKVERGLLHYEDGVDADNNTDELKVVELKADKTNRFIIICFIVVFVVVLIKTGIATYFLINHFDSKYAKEKEEQQFKNESDFYSSIKSHQ